MSYECSQPCRFPGVLPGLQQCAAPGPHVHTQLCPLESGMALALLPLRTRLPSCSCVHSPTVRPCGPAGLFSCVFSVSVRSDAKLKEKLGEPCREFPNVLSPVSLAFNISHVLCLCLHPQPLFSEPCESRSRVSGFLPSVFLFISPIRRLFSDLEGLDSWAVCTPARSAWAVASGCLTL